MAGSGQRGVNNRFVDLICYQYFIIHCIQSKARVTKRDVPPKTNSHHHPLFGRRYPKLPDRPARADHDLTQLEAKVWLPPVRSYGAIISGVRGVPTIRHTRGTPSLGRASMVIASQRALPRSGTRGSCSCATRRFPFRTAPSRGSCSDKDYVSM